MDVCQDVEDAARRGNEAPMYMKIAKLVQMHRVIDSFRADYKAGKMPTR